MIQRRAKMSLQEDALPVIRSKLQAAVYSLKNEFHASDSRGDFQ